MSYQCSNYWSLTVHVIISRFTVNTLTGAVSNLEALDYETQNRHEFTVFAHDSGTPSLLGHADIIVIVNDVNDNIPMFTSAVYTGFYYNTVPIGTSVLQVMVSGVRVFTWSFCM